MSKHELIGAKGSIPIPVNITVTNVHEIVIDGSKIVCITGKDKDGNLYWSNTESFKLSTNNEAIERLSNRFTEIGLASSASGKAISDAMNVVRRNFI